MADGGVIIAVVGVGVAILGVIVPLLLTMRGDVRELRRADIDKRLVAVETLLHERTRTPGSTRNPIPPDGNPTTKCIDAAWRSSGSGWERSPVP